MKYTESEAKHDGREYRSKHNWGDASVSLRNVQHPKPYGNWDLNLRISPSIHLDKTVLEAKEPRVLPSGIVTTYPEINIRRLSGFVNLKLAGHTPIGQFVATAGHGLAGYHARDGQGFDTRRTSEIQRFELVYIGFFNKKVFFLAGPRYYNDGNDLEQIVFAFRIGYYWGRIEK